MRWIAILTGVMTLFVAAFALLAATMLGAQQPSGFASGTAARDALKQAEADLSAAKRRVGELERRAAAATKAAVKADRESAALAARIQQTEAQITATEVRLTLIQDQQANLDLKLAERREPLMRLTAALQRLARRPLALSALRSGSLNEAVYLRAMLATTLPQVEQRTLGLRDELAQGRKLADRARQALTDLHATEKALKDQRGQLALLEAGQRESSRDASVAARRETERAFALAEEARDLDSLVGQLDRAGQLRRKLAALHGPVLRPPRPGDSEVVANADSRPDAARPTPLRDFRLPVIGRILAGFGASDGRGARMRGIAIAPRGSAVVVAPAAGRIAFAGPYRGYGRIVIVEHDGGWTSLITGLARVDATVGAQVVAGAPLGRAPAREPRISLELMEGGKPVNPLELVG